mmetsp:Transcript_22342/g.40158  ORF Transcript_22342/g.40158 Transcript_22342/m.40158 type:complete len:303 (-) Transcript_22342:37-945(-)
MVLDQSASSALPGAPIPAHVTMVSGGLAGVAAATATNPLDVLRTRMQASRSTARAMGNKDLYATFLHMSRAGVRQGLFSGWLANVAAAVSSRALHLTVYSQYKTLFGAWFPQHFNITTGVAALAAAATTAAIVNPLYVVRVRVQLEPPGGQSVRAIAREVWQSGPRGMGRGLLAGLLGKAIENPVFFVLYEQGKKRLLRNEDVTASTVMSAKVLMLSVVARTCSAVVAYPLLVVQTQVRELNPTTGCPAFRGVVSTARSVLRDEGPRGLYHGLTPHLLRVLPSTGVTFLVYEMMVRWFGYQP